jgi:hypothetical protein
MTSYPQVAVARILDGMRGYGTDQLRGEVAARFDDAIAAIAQDRTASLELARLLADAHGHVLVTADAAAAHEAAGALADCAHGVLASAARPPVAPHTMRLIPTVKLEQLSSCLDDLEG